MNSETLEFNAHQIEINRIETKTRINFLILKVLEVSELFESNRNEINRIEPNRTKSNRNQSNRIPSTHYIREFHCIGTQKT